MENGLSKVETSEITQKIDEMNRVVQFRLKGYTVPEIVKITKLPRGRILDYLDEWKVWAKEQQDVSGRAREMLASVDQHYDMIMKELWEVVHQADARNELGTKNAALKNLAAVEKDRANTFRDAGLDEQSSLADQMREVEEKQEKLKAILRDVTGHCHNCRTEVARRLSEITGKTEVLMEDEIVIES